MASVHHYSDSVHSIYNFSIFAFSFFCSEVAGKLANFPGGHAKPHAMTGTGTGTGRSGAAKDVILAG